MRGATGVSHQRHEVLRLPRKMHRVIDPRDICNVSYNARSNRCHPPTSRSIVPATKNASRHRSSWHMQRHLQCAQQQASPSSLTKYCACHEKWIVSLLLVTYATSFIMRGATGITLQPHQILRLPRKMNRIVHPRGICNVIYNARSNRLHTPTSPNTARATQNNTPKSKRNLPKTAEVSFSMRGRFDHDRSMIPPGSEHDPTMNSSSLTRPVRRGYFSRFGDTSCFENYNVSRSGYLPNFHQILRLPRKVTLQRYQIVHLPRKVTLQQYQIVHLPRRRTKLLLYWSVTCLSCYFTELLLYWGVTSLSCLTELLLFWAVTLLSCHFTELSFYWAVTSLSRYFTELSLYWAVTELSLYWAITLLSYQ